MACTDIPALPIALPGDTPVCCLPPDALTINLHTNSYTGNMCAIFVFAISGAFGSFWFGNSQGVSCSGGTVPPWLSLSSFGCRLGTATVDVIAALLAGETSLSVQTYGSLNDCFGQSAANVTDTAAFASGASSPVTRSLTAKCWVGCSDFCAQDCSELVGNWTCDLVNRTIS